MLLTLFAIAVGALIGRLRGGHHHGFVRTTIKAKALLISAVAAALVLTVLTPSQPLFWTAIVVLAGFGFMLSNLHLTGMITMAIGLALNVIPLLANGAMPVSERALRSVGHVDADGVPIVEGVRETVSAAPNLAVLGDVVPVPLFGAVVSIGDLIMLVALADVVTNIFLRGRRNVDDDGIWFADSERELVLDDDVVIDLTGHEPLVHRGPAHASAGSMFSFAGTLAWQMAAASSRLPEHVRLATTQPPPPTGDPILAPPPISPAAVAAAAGPTTEAEPAIDLSGEQPVLDLTEGEPHADRTTTATLVAERDVEESPEPPAVDLTDRRPIIDLTVSPSDEQMAEFLRRRSEADRRLADAQLAPVAPGHRRARLRSRRRHGSRTPASR